MLPARSCSKPGTFLLNSERKFDNIYFLKTLFLVKKILCHVGWSLDNPNENFESKLRKIFAQTPKTFLQLKNLLKHFSLKTILWTWEKKFQQGCRKNVARKSESFSLKDWKWLFNWNFSKIKRSSWNGSSSLLNAISTSLLKSCHRKQ